MSEQQEAPTTSDVAGGDHPSEQSREPSQQAVAMMIAKRLGETTTGARVQLRRIVQAVGRTQARALLGETLRIEDNGGMLVPDSSRRRTARGVFFYLVSTSGQPTPGRTLMRRAASAPIDERRPP